MAIIIQNYHKPKYVVKESSQVFCFGHTPLIKGNSITKLTYYLGINVLPVRNFDFQIHFDVKIRYLGKFEIELPLVMLGYWTHHPKLSCFYFLSIIPHY